MNCPACGHENRETAKFCEECGERFAKSCASCGSELRSGAKFCDECGTPIGRAEAPSPPERDPRDYTPNHLADKILQSKSALEDERKQVTVAAGRVVRFIPALNIPEDDLGEAVDIVLDLVVG